MFFALKLREYFSLIQVPFYRFYRLEVVRFSGMRPYLCRYVFFIWSFSWIMLYASVHERYLSFSRKNKKCPWKPLLVFVFRFFHSWKIFSFLSVDHWPSFKIMWILYKTGVLKGVCEGVGIVKRLVIWVFRLFFVLDVVFFWVICVHGPWWR